MVRLITLNYTQMKIFTLMLLRNKKTFTLMKMSGCPFIGRNSPKPQKIDLSHQDKNFKCQ